MYIYVILLLLLLLSSLLLLYYMNVLYVMFIHDPRLPISQAIETRLPQVETLRDQGRRPAAFGLRRAAGPAGRRRLGRRSRNWRLFQGERCDYDGDMMGVELRDLRDMGVSINGGPEKMVGF